MSDKEKLGLHNLRKPAGATKDPKRKGRGTGSGLGKTAGRGEKGQRSRSGGGVRPGFEGGQMPLIRRVPKRGFTNPFKEEYQLVSLRDLDRLEGDAVNPETLVAAGLIKKAAKPVKILANGDVNRAYAVSDCAISAGAKSKVEAAGGSVES